MIARMLGRFLMDASELQAAGLKIHNLGLRVEDLMFRPLGLRI